MEHCKNLSFMRLAHKLSILFALLFVICFAWYWINPVEQTLHLSLFKMSFFAFSGMNVISFIFGLIQSFIWGHIVAGLILISIKACYGKCCREKCCKEGGEPCKEGDKRDCCREEKKEERKEEMHKE